MSESCSNCRFWQKKTSQTGFCCAHPPVRVDSAISSFPTTGAVTWCGEWQSVPAQPEQQAKPAKTPVWSSSAKKAVDKSAPPS